MPATGSDFSTTSDKTVLGFALAEFQLLQLLTEGPSPELLPAILHGEVVSLQRGVKRREHVTLTLGETLKSTQNEKFHIAALSSPI